MPAPTSTPLHPVYIDQLATRYPTLGIVLGHGGWPWIQETAGVAFKHPTSLFHPISIFLLQEHRDISDAVDGALQDRFLSLLPTLCDLSAKRYGNVAPFHLAKS